MTPHLYPARPGMLRRGGSVAWVNPRTGVATCGVMIDETIYAQDEVRDWRSGPVHPSCEHPDHIDLRDVTARAHAAMVYTESEAGPYTSYFGWDGLQVIELLDQAALDERDERNTDHGPVNKHCLVLVRMRSFDESVTVAEARAALDWAHAASGGAA